MNPAELYEQRAAECFLLADELYDLQLRKVMHELALCWLRLAARANENQQQAASEDCSTSESFLRSRAPHRHAPS